MTCLFHDVKKKIHDDANPAANRVIGADFDEVLYADDSIIFSEDDETLENCCMGLRR